MQKLLIVLSVGVGLLSGLVSCGESQDATSRLDRTLGRQKEGAPLGPTVFDPGILQNGTTYQAPRLAANLSGTALPPAAASGGQAGSGTGAASSAEQAVRVAVSSLLAALQDGEVDLALRMFRTDDVAPLIEKSDVIFATFATVDTLERYLKGRFEPTRARELTARLRGLSSSPPRWDVLDAASASVTPNVALGLLGPERGRGTLRLVLADGEWRFQLESPLTSAEVQAIIAYHEKLQQEVDKIIDWLGRVPTAEEATVAAAIEAAAAGKPVDLPEPQPSEEFTPAPAAEPAPGEPPKEQSGAPAPQPGRGRGRGIRPPG